MVLFPGVPSHLDPWEAPSHLCPGRWGVGGWAVYWRPQLVALGCACHPRECARAGQGVHLTCLCVLLSLLHVV